MRLVIDTAMYNQVKIILPRIISFELHSASKLLSGIRHRTVIVVEGTLSFVINCLVLVLSDP
jgi:hypothetical protein